MTERLREEAEETRTEVDQLAYKLLELRGRPGLAPGIRWDGRWAIRPLVRLDRVSGRHGWHGWHGWHEVNQREPHGKRRLPQEAIPPD